MSEQIFVKGLDQFKALLDYLLGTRSRHFVFEILPSSFPWPENHESCLLIEGDAAAIRKSDLIKAFLSAQSCLISNASQQNGSGQQVSSLPEVLSGFDTRDTAWVVLIYDPEHLTAANYLKRALGRIDGSSHDEVLTELIFCQSILTSPLHKHAKSPTLWSYRLWIMRKFRPWTSEAGKILFLSSDSTVPVRQISSTETCPEEQGAALWLAELSVALRAAEQHGRNYHAFHYLRSLCFMLEGCEMSERVSTGWSLARAETIRRLTKWCLQHPRDISGLTFLAWLVRKVSDDPGLRDDVEQTIGAVKDFRSNLQWQGESIDMFLRVTSELDAH